MPSLDPRRRLDPASWREILLVAVLGALAGGIVLLVAVEVFPYHSSNHDEGVYLQQAEMLLAGQFNLYPGAISDSVRPWFFVDVGDRLYPKYPPLPAGLFAGAMFLFGDPRSALALVAAGNAVLVYVLGRMAFDRRIGVVAAILFSTAPMTVLSSSVFLPYAPTTLFNLLFAVCYLRTRRTGRVTTAALAGGAIGVAFFMRPFTAVLFALPFVTHAGVEVVRTVRVELGDPSDASLGRLSSAIGLHLVTAMAGVVFVALTLAYNLSVTGDPLRFPYMAFAPLDGPGFGRREILDHAVEYDPRLALRANAYVLWYLFTRWVPLGALGTVLAATGFLGSVVWAERWRGDELGRRLLAGLLVAVPAGNVLFWGNYNILATMADPTDGLLGQFGPFYHFDLLAPIAILAAAGAVTLSGVARHAVERSALGAMLRRPSWTVPVAVVGLLLLASVNGALLTGPVERNLDHTETYERAYAPLEDRPFEEALVFLPTPYGPWLNHPFQYLRNEPGYDGRVVYAMDRDPARNFAVLDAFPERRPYRYTYRGEWRPRAEDRAIEPALEPLTVRRGPSLAGATLVGVPDQVTHATIVLESDGQTDRLVVEDVNDTIHLAWAIDERGAHLRDVDGRAANASVDLGETDEVVLKVRFVQSEGATMTYRQAMAVRTRSGTVEVLWPPARSVCPLVDACGRAGTVLPGEAGPSDQTRFETMLVAVSSTRTTSAAADAPGGTP